MINAIGCSLIALVGSDPETHLTNTGVTANSYHQVGSYPGLKLSSQVLLPELKKTTRQFLPPIVIFNPLDFSFKSIEVL